MAKANLTKTANIQINPREVDFVTRFSSNWRALQEIAGISRFIEKRPGEVLRIIEAKWEPQDGLIGEGEEIPYSLANVVQKPIGEATIEKYGKGVSIEAISTYGYADAVARTDNAMLNKLQSIVMNRFFKFALTGTNTGSYDDFQMALAMARGQVINFFEAAQLDVSEVVGFVNILDLYTYLGSADITIQTAFGMQYIQNFLGYRTVFLADSSRIPRGTVLAIPIENLIAYYVDPANSDFVAAGFEFTIDGETPLLGFHTEGDYKTLVSENTAIMGFYLMFEYINGVAVNTFGTPGTYGITVSNATRTVAAGATVTITATTVPADALVQWSSSDETRATVVDGVITGVAAGTANIVATTVIGGTTYTATCVVTVTA